MNKNNNKTGIYFQIKIFQLKGIVDTLKYIN